METTFTINQNLTFWEYISATFYVSLSGKLLKRFFFLLIVLAVLNMLLGYATTSESLDVLTIFTYLVPILFLFLMALSLGFIICLYIYKGKPYLFKNISYEFTHWGVIRNGERTEFSKPWREISRFKETKDFFLLFSGNSDWHTIQKRMFKDPKQLNDFRYLLEEKINN